MSKDDFEVVLARIKEKAASDWPDDYDMQLFEVQKQLDAMNTLGELIDQLSDDEEMMRIFLKARDDWPDDFDMQVFEINKQLEARNALNQI